MAVTGDLDCCTAPLLLQTFADCLQRSTRALEVDLAAVTFFNAAAISAVARVRAQAAAAGTRLQFIELGPAVERVQRILAEDPHRGPVVVALFANPPHLDPTASVAHRTGERG